MRGDAAPRVFISYAHESAEHREAVRALWLFLRANGVDAQLDQLAAGQRQDWTLWMEKEIAAADHILVVASPAYRRRAGAAADADEGWGVQYEARLIREVFYRDQSRLERFLPVVLPGGSIDDVPAFLTPSIATVYAISDFTVPGAQALLRVLFRRPVEVLPDLGPAPALPPRDHKLRRPEPDPAASGRQLLEILCAAYRTRSAITAFLRQTPVRPSNIRLDGTVAEVWASIMEEAVRTGVTRETIEAALADRSISDHHDALAELLPAKVERAHAPANLLLEAAAALLQYVERSRSPIVIAVEADDDLLDESELERTACHLTMTFTRAQVTTLAAAREAGERAATIDEIVAAGRRVWQALTEIEPRIDAVRDRIVAGGLAQPVAWCGRPELLESVARAVRIAHTGGYGAHGFFLVGAGGHYFTPVHRRGDTRDARTMNPRLAVAGPSYGRYDVRDRPVEQAKAALVTATTDVVVAIHPQSEPLLAGVGDAMRGGGTRPTRAVLAFGGEARASDIDELLTTIPFVSCADVTLADDAVIEAVAALLHRHAETVALPCIVSAVRAAWIDAAMERGAVADCRSGLAWGIWSWVGLPLFARRYDEVERPLYPHLMDLRSIASREWYFDRRQRIDAAYQADALARPGEPADRFHLYLSGAGGTGKSCFLQHVYDEIESRGAGIPVWYRVDAPNSTWESVDEHVRAEITKIVDDRLDAAAMQELESLPANLGDFLLGAAALLRERIPGFDEIAIFIDQLERTFESGDTPNDVRLERISRELIGLLDDVGTDNGIRVFVASRKQYLPDFLVSFRAAASCRLEFNVLQVISDENERIEFVLRIVDWCRRQQLISRSVSMTDDATRVLVRNVDGNPLNMMLALIELLSHSGGGPITADDVKRHRPWSRLFQLDLAAVERDELDLYFLLAMAHARTEIVRFEEVWWRIRMVSQRLTRRVNELGSNGVRERLWLLGIVGRTVYARPDAGEPMRYVEFFHANLRDYLLREVMGRGWSETGASAGRHRGTPPAWRALDRLSVFAHDWQQTLQPLLAEEVRDLVEHRDEVVATGLAPDDHGVLPFHLLFLRDPPEVRTALKEAATACFAYSALVHDEGGRRTVELLYDDAEKRAAQCRDWLLRSPAELRPPVLRYLVTLEDQPARDLLVELFLDLSGPLGEQMARAGALVLSEPLSAARSRNNVVLVVLTAALRRVGGDPGRLPASVVAFVVAACAYDRDTILGRIKYCVDRMTTSEDANVQAMAPRLTAFSGMDGWIGSAGEAPLLEAASVADQVDPTGSPLRLTVGADLRGVLTAARLAELSADLRRVIGLPLPGLALGEGEVEPDECELRLSGRRVSRAVFRPGALRVTKWMWELAAGPEAPDALIEGLDGDEDVLWLPPATVEAAGYLPPALTVDAAIAHWLEDRCRDEFEQLFDAELLIAFVREASSTPAGRNRLRRVGGQFRRVFVELVQEGVPIASRDAVLERMAELAPRVRSPEILTQKVREFLKADICRSVADDAGQVTAIVLDEELEQRWADRPSPNWISTAEALRFDRAIHLLVSRAREGEIGPPLVLVTVPRLRRALAQLLRRLGRRLPVLSFTELDDVIPVPGGQVDIELDSRSPA